MKDMTHRGSEKGFTLVELVISASLVTVSTLVGAILLNDYMATARTLRVHSEGNVQLVGLIKDISRDFQTSTSFKRACILKRVTGEATDPTWNLNQFNCHTDQFQPTDGIGLNISADGTSPEFAYINTCEKYDTKKLPVGRGGPHTPPDTPNTLQWGGSKTTCPAACPAGTRPVVKYLKKGTGLVDAKQVPKKTNDSGSLELWGAVACGSEFVDLRQIQKLKGKDFIAQYMNVLIFLGRGRFDIRYPTVTTADGSKKKQSYVWMTGGTVLDFLDSQEMSIFRCPLNNPNC
ncbi:MAG: type II secretion system protein [Silvanigrellaceae bacterium]